MTNLYLFLLVYLIIGAGIAFFVDIYDSKIYLRDIGLFIYAMILAPAVMLGFVLESLFIKLSEIFINKIS